MPVHKIVRDDVDKFLDYDINLPTRTLYIGSCSDSWDEGESGVDFQMAERVIKGLHILDNLVANGGITLIMNNPGGDFYHGMAIYDAIQDCRHHVTIVATGYVMSMGSVIMQAADTRLMMPNAKMMLHYGTDGLSSIHHKDFMAFADESKKLRDWMVDLYLTKIQDVDPEYTWAQVEELIKYDKYLSSQEAVDLGLADAIKFPQQTQGL